MTNYENMSNEELLNELTNLLTKEETKTIEAMTIGLNLKVGELNKIKRLLIQANPQKTKEFLELALAKALALTKTELGSSLELDTNGKLAVMARIGSKETVSDDLIENFKFMANLSDLTDKSLELALIESAFKKVIDLSETILENLSPQVVLEIRRRVTGIQSVGEEDLALLTL